MPDSVNQSSSLKLLHRKKSCILYSLKILKTDSWKIKDTTEIDAIFYESAFIQISDNSYLKVLKESSDSFKSGTEE